MKKKFLNQEGNSNKFWNIEIDGSSFKVTYGKVGTDGTSTEKKFGDNATCRKEAEKLITEKTKKGYKEIKEGEEIPHKEIIKKQKLDFQKLTSAEAEKIIKEKVKKSFYKELNKYPIFEEDYKIGYYDGNIITDSFFFLGDFDVLVVNGNLTAKNIFVKTENRDYSHLIVLGNVECENFAMDYYGTVLIQGNMTVKGLLYPGEDDCIFLLFGNLEAKYVYVCFCGIEICEEKKNMLNINVDYFEDDGSERRIKSKNKLKNGQSILEFLNEAVLDYSEWKELSKEEQKEVLEDDSKWDYITLDVHKLHQQMKKLLPITK